MAIDKFRLSPNFQRVSKYLKAFQPHDEHKKTVELSKDYVAYVTGEGLDKMLRRVVRRESEELFEQRKLLTESTIPCTTMRVLDVFRKVQRTAYKKKIELRGKDGNDEKKEAALKGILNKFHSGRPLDKYLFERLLELGSIDPNAFIVVEWKPFDPNHEYVQPYPFEVRSENVADFNYQNGVLTMLAVKATYRATSGTRFKDLTTTTVYLEDQTLVYRQMPDWESVKYPSSTMKDGEYLELDSKGEDSEAEYLYVSQRKYFHVKFLVPHNLGMVPAVRVGYVPNLANDKKTMVANYHKAVPLLRKTLKGESESDLTNALSAFPLPLSYRAACNHQGCVSGKLADDTVCKSCKGTGFMRSTTVQEEIVFKLPKSASDAFRLSEMFHFVAPPVELLKFQTEMIENLTRRAISTVFNSDVFSRQEIADTATGKNISLQNVYDNLVAFSDHIAWVWWVFVLIVAKATDLNKDLILEHELVFSKDFKLKGLNDVLEELKSAADSKASPAAIEALQRELMRLLLSDEEYQRYDAVADFNPFSGLSSEEIAMALNSSFVPVKSKVLYFNLNQIITDLERAQSGFYDLDYDAKKKMIDAKVDEIIASIPVAAVPII